MPLETTMLCLDNSEYARNSDYTPTRLEALQESANLVGTAKAHSNPENTVGIMSLAGRNPELLLSPTDDMRKIMNSIHDVKMSGHLSFADGVQIAYLALKHRRNKNGGQRIVVFVGSPVMDESKKLTTLAKMLNKNNIAVDVVSIGEIDENQEKLEFFVKTVNKDNNSNLVSIPPGCMPSEVLRSSPIVSENTGASSDGAMGFDASGGVAGVGAGANDDFGGVDPNMDPELAMVLRVSMEEERARQESEAAANPSSPAANNGATAAAAGDDATSANMDVDSAETAPVASPADQQITGGEAEDQELLQQALALSMNDGDAGDMDMDGMDEEMMMALQMSMQMDSASASAPGASATTQPTPTSGMGAEAKEEGTDVASTTPQASTQFHDDGFIANMLESLPGVDPSDPQIQQALQRFQNSNAGGTKDTQKKDEKEK